MEDRKNGGNGEGRHTHRQSGAAPNYVPGCDLKKEWAGKITLTEMNSLILSVAPFTAFCCNARHRRRNR